MQLLQPSHPENSEKNTKKKKESIGLTNMLLSLSTICGKIFPQRFAHTNNFILLSKYKAGGGELKESEGKHGAK